MSPTPSPDEADSWGTTLRGVVADPAWMTLIGVLLIVLAAVIVRVPLPEAFWPVFAGVLSGSAQSKIRRR